MNAPYSDNNKVTNKKTVAKEAKPIKRRYIQKPKDVLNTQKSQVPTNLLNVAEYADNNNISDSPDGPDAPPPSSFTGQAEMPWPPVEKEVEEDIKLRSEAGDVLAGVEKPRAPRFIPFRQQKGLGNGY